MITRLLGIRPADRRAAVMGSGTLLLVIAGHTVLETARDALFLSARPAAHLPWAYLAIAALSFVVGLVGGRRGSRGATRGGLQVTLVGGAVVTVAFWWLATAATPNVVLALYVWTGVFTSVVVMLLWLVLSEHVDLGQAKRIYALVAAGGLAGATLGGALAAALQQQLGSPRDLLLATSALYVLAAIVPGIAGPAVGTISAEPAPAGLSALRLVREDPYLRRVVAVSILPAVVFTGIDFVFKSLVSRDVPVDDLGPFFARYNFAVYGAALLVHLLLASRLLRGVGVIRGLAILPTLLLIGSSAFAVTGGLLAVLALKGADVAFRHSLHRASTEILFLPIPPGVRGPMKALADGLGQRGGQALASLLLLWASRRGVGVPVMGAGLALMSAGWLALVLELRRHYVARFRSHLSDLHGEDEVTIPELDLHSLEALVAALGSSNDDEVIAAIDILERYEKNDLVSPFILYHPSRTVALRAMELFAGSAREDVALIQRRLLEHGDATIRATALRSLGPAEFDRHRLWQVVQEDPSPEVRATALTVLLYRWTDPDEGAEAERLVREALAGWPAPARAALARTVGSLPRAVGVRLARELVDDGDGVVRRDLAVALTEVPTDEFLETYTSLVAFRESREPARRAIVALGAAALRRLEERLDDPATPAPVRLHLPRTISRFQNEYAAAILVRALARTTDSRIRYKILRGLGRMRANDPSLVVDRAALLAQANAALARAVTVLLYAVACDHAGALRQGPRPEIGLLAPLLVEKQRRALERVFRILHILEPTEQYRGMFQGLASDDPHVQASSRELLEHVVDEPSLRGGILAMTERVPAVQRLARAASFCDAPLARRLVAVVAVGGDDRSNAASAAELDAALDAVMATMTADLDPVLAAVAAQALGRPSMLSEARAS